MIKDNPSEGHFISKPKLEELNKKEDNIMNNQIKIFENNEFGKIRAIEYNNEPYFVAKDICDILAHTNPTVALNRLDDDEKIKIDPKLYLGSKSNQEFWAINESGLYSLVLTSNKTEAKKFKKWVTSEVLPSIRNHGFYATDNWLESALSNPENMINILTQYKEEREKRLLAEQTIEIQKPKVEYFDALIDRNLLTSFRDTAKEIKVPERQFIKFLEDKKFIFRDKNAKIKPYSQHVPNLFEIKEWQTEHKAGQQVLITPKGRETFRVLTQSIQK